MTTSSLTALQLLWPRWMRKLGAFLFTTWLGYMLQGYELAAWVIFTCGVIFAFDALGVWGGECWTNARIAPLVAIIIVVFGYGLAQWTRSFSDIGTVAQSDIKHFEDIAKHAGEEAAKQYMEDRLRSPAPRELFAAFLRLLLRSLEPGVPSEMRKALEQNIGLYEFYAKYEWPLTGYTELQPFPLSGVTLKSKFERDRKYRLTPLIRNDNDGIPLLEPRIIVRLPIEVTVTQTKWTSNVSNTYREFHGEGFGPVVKEQYRGLNDSLFLQFSHAGSYPVSYVIHGLAKGISVSAHGDFVLEVR